MICCKYCGRKTRRFFDTFCSECCSSPIKNSLRLDYKRQEPVNRDHIEVLIRIVAALLAVIGAFWGFLLFAIFHSEGDPLRVLIFALITVPGYLVTGGYLWRAVLRPAYHYRVAIWVASILVQGAWLAISLFDGRPSVAMLWWFIACAASIAALSIESND